MMDSNTAQKIGNTPRVLRPKFEGVPELLRLLPRWVAWNVGKPKADGGGRYEKIPVNAKTGKACNAHDPANWLTFEDVCRAYETGRFAGIAIDLPNERESVATADDASPLFLIGGDIDECVSKDDNGKPAISAEAKTVLLRLGMPYHELSPSGTGLRFFALHREPLPAGNKDGREMYSGGRFLTITGRGAGEIKEVPELAAQHAEWFPAKTTMTRTLDASETLTGRGVEPETPENIARVKSALAALPADCEYQEWRDIVFAVLSTDWNCAEQLAQDWSATAESFDEGAFEKLVRSHKPGGGITLGSLFFKAKEAGWQDPRTVSANLFETLNDAGNADRLIATFGNRLRYVPELRTWLVWHKGHWRYDRKGQIIELAKIVSKAIYKEAADASSPADRNALSKWANASLQLSRLEAMVKLAQPALSVSVTELDSDPMLLAVKNGAIDLRNGAFREARPDDLLTRIAGVEYVAGATCPIWEAMLAGCMGGDKDLIDALQRAAGYSLTGLTTEQCFFFLYGTGANGKTTFVNALREIMGGHGMQSQPETIMAQRNNNPSGPTPELARLAGVRFVAMVETEDGQRLAESRIKQLTGGDAMTARVLHGAPFDFTPIFKLWLAGNHRPVIRGDDHGIWRRIVLIPFTVCIPPEQRDKNLPAKLRDEYPGILNWLLDGCLAWQRHGLALPPSVTKEVAAYKTAMDLLAQWLDERCDIHPTNTWGARAAYQNFSTWLKDGGHHPITEVRFAQKMDERGFTKAKTKHGAIYQGIAPRQGAFI